jgi:hypothetical protein
LKIWHKKPSSVVLYQSHATQPTKEQQYFTHPSYVTPLTAFGNPVAVGRVATPPVLVRFV